MSAHNFKVVFQLDEQDASYFRGLYRKAKKGAAALDRDQVIADAEALVKKVQGSKKVPPFVSRAIEPLADLIQLLQDKDYSVPKPVEKDIVAGIAYFAEPEDLIPDHVPVLGYLDDAIMVRFLEDEFQDEIWAYRKFRGYRETAEQRPWSQAARERLPAQLQSKTAELRAKITERKEKRGRKGRFSW